MIQLPLLTVPLLPGETVRFIESAAIFGNRRVTGTVTAVFSDTYDRHVRAVVKWTTGHELPTPEAALERTR